MSPNILVTGASGNVGSEVVKCLIGKASFRIGAYQVEIAQNALGMAHDYTRFDFLDPSTFGPTFDGIKKMFLVRPPALANVQRDIAPALIAAKQVGVEHVVFLSLQGVEKNWLVPHHKIEKLIRELGFAYTFLRSSFFMQNLSTTHCAEIRDHSEIAIPVGKAKTSFIDVRDIAAVAVRALVEDGHQNKAYTLTGSTALDYDQVSKLLTARLGRPIRYTDPSIFTFLRQQVAAGRSFSFALVMAGLYTITRFGNAKEATPDIRTILGREPIGFEQFVEDYSACWLPQ